MKKVILNIAFVFSGILMQAQSDFEIANALIKSDYDSIGLIAQKLGVELKVDSEHNVIVKIGETIKVFTTEPIKVYDKLYVGRVFRRYKANNPQDVEDFFAYDTPQNDSLVEYEKSMGVSWGHLDLKVIRKEFKSKMKKII